MRGGSTQRALYIGGVDRPNRTKAATSRRGSSLQRTSGNLEQPVGRRGARKKSKEINVYRRRRILAICVVLLGALALVFAVFTQTSGSREQTLPIDPNNAVPDVLLAEVARVGIFTPIRPEELTGLGYHPEGESLIEISPRGKNLSGNSLIGLFAYDSTPEKLQYYIMDSASRQGPSTGALDVGAEAGTAVYAPVTGTVTAIRPDPVLQESAKVVEIKPIDNPNIRVSISLVQSIEDEVGPRSPVTAGMTRLGSVADSSKVLKPQLAYYTSDAGNHVTISASKVN